MSQQPFKDIPSQKEVVASIVAYSFCSSSMILANKIAMVNIPFGAVVMAIQFTVSTLFVLIGKRLRYLAVDEIHWKYVKPYMAFVAIFTFDGFCNMNALRVSNVETVVVFRSCTPLVVSVLDFIFLGRELPNMRSVASLLVLIMGVAGYVLTDSEFALNGWRAYIWVFLYFLSVCCEMTYGKKVASSVPLRTNSGPVLYTSMLSIPAALFLATANNEIAGFYTFVQEGGLTRQAILSLALSCMIGTSISYTTWYCRSKISAAFYTLIGVVNKFLAVLVNILMWDKHASVFGIFCLVVCLAGSSLYQQAPMRVK